MNNIDKPPMLNTMFDFSLDVDIYIFGGNSLLSIIFVTEVHFFVKAF